MRGWSYITTCKIGLSFLFLTNCSYKIQKLDLLANEVNSTLSDDTLIDVELVMKYSLKSCQNCHAGARPPSLDSVAALIANRDLILTEVQSGDMPPSTAGYSALSDCQKAIVKAWVDQTPNTVGEIQVCKNSGPGTTPELPVIPIELLPLNYETLKTKILLPKCVLCHNSSGEDWDAAQIPFTSFAEITSGEYSNYWSAPAANSKVIEEVTETDGEIGMPPPDSKVQPLTPEEIDFIVRWIDAGKPEK
jgi:hypothetical protein